MNSTSQETINFVKSFITEKNNLQYAIDFSVEDSSPFWKELQNGQSYSLLCEFMPISKGNVRFDDKNAKLSGEVIFKMEDGICGVSLIVSKDSTGVKSVYKGFAIIETMYSNKNNKIDNDVKYFSKSLCWIFLMLDNGKHGEFVVMTLDLLNKAMPQSIYIGQVLTTDSHYFNSQLFKFLLFEDKAKNFVDKEAKNLGWFTVLAPSIIHLRHKYSRQIVKICKGKNVNYEKLDPSLKKLAKMLGVDKCYTKFINKIKSNFYITPNYSKEDETNKEGFHIIVHEKEYKILNLIEPPTIGYKGKSRDSILFALLLSWVRGSEEVDDFDNKYKSRGVSIKNNTITTSNTKEINYIYENFQKEVKDKIIEKAQYNKQKLSSIYRTNVNTVFKDNVLIKFIEHHFGASPHYRSSFTNSKSLFDNNSNETRLHYTSLQLTDTGHLIQRGDLTLSRKYNGLCEAVLTLKRTSIGYSTVSKGFAIVTNPDNQEKSDCWVFLRTSEMTNNDRKIEIEIETDKGAERLYNNYTICMCFSLYATTTNEIPRFKIRIIHAVTSRLIDGNSVMFRALLSKQYISDKNISKYFYPFMRMLPTSIYIERRFYDDLIEYLNNLNRKEENKRYNNPHSIQVYKSIDEHFRNTLKDGLSKEDVQVLLEMLHPTPNTLLGLKRIKKKKYNKFTEIELRVKGEFNDDDSSHRDILIILTWLRGRSKLKKKNRTTIDGYKKVTTSRSIYATRSHTTKHRHIDIENLYEWVMNDES